MRVPHAPRELTGKHVLICFVGFFEIVFAVNAVMVKAAMSTFGGVQTTSSYKAGLMFGQDVARAEQQDALHCAGQRQAFTRSWRQCHPRYFSA